MPKFTTISPTHINGMKPHTWGRFRDGGYVAIGWLYDKDLTGKQLQEIFGLINIGRLASPELYPNDESARQAFKKFLSLEKGDYVAVNNSGAGLFGIGVIKSGYRFGVHKHDSGAEDKREWYSHFMDVEWKVTTYARKNEIVRDGETGWMPRGTVGKVYGDLPPYARRFLGMAVPIAAPHVETVRLRPQFLEPIIRKVETLRAQQHHTERDHESLVEDFFVSLGHRQHEDIRFRQGRVDILLRTNGKAVVVVEVKRDWGLNTHNADSAIWQAYRYAHEQGVRYVLVTNGDTYILFDRLRGLSYSTHRLGEFQLTSLRDQDLVLISRLYPGSLEDS